MDQSLLDQFWKLSESKEGTRIDAAVKILFHLNNKKAGVVQNGVATEDVEEEEEKKKGEETEENVVDYVLKRLIRGLGSERESSRQGFFVCLVELLRSSVTSADDVAAAKVMEVMENNLTVSGSRAEEGSLAYGKVAALGALIRSGKVHAKSPEIGLVLEKLVEVSKKRSYLVPLAYHFIVDFIGKEGMDEEAFKANVWPVLCKSFSWSGPDASLSSLWIMLEIHAKFPSLFTKAFVLENFQRKKLLDENLAQEVCSLAVKGNVPVHVLHGGPFLKRVVQTFGAAKGDLLLTFWTKYAAPNIVKSSCYKTSVGFVILDLILANLTDLKRAPYFLTPHVVGVIHHLFTKMMLKPDDKALVMCVLERVANIAKEEAQTQVPLLKALMNCSVAFDKVTGAGTVQKILTVATDFEVVKYAAGLYRQAVVGHGDDDEADDRHIYTSQERIYSANQLTKIISHPASQTEVAWKQDCLNFLLATTLFNLKRPFGSVTKAPLAFSKDFQKVTKDVFFKAMEVKAKSFESMCEVLYATMEFACSLLKASGSSGDSGVALAAGSMSSKAEAEWSKMVKAVKKIHSQSVVSKEDRVFEVLYLHVGFQLLAAGSNDDSATVESLQDLHVCFAKSKEKSSASGNSSKKKNKKKAGKSEEAAGDDDDDDDEEEPKWVEVVVDLLLSLLSQDKHVLRQVAGSVTSLLCPHMTINALNSVLEVVVDDQEEAKKDDEDEEEDQEMDEDEKEESEEEEDSEEEEEEEDIEDEAGDKEVDEEFRNKVKEALGEGAAETDDDDGAGSVDMDDLDDEDMDRMDAALAKVFKQLSGKKNWMELKREKEDAVAKMHFKIRALDIVDVYLSHGGQVPMSHALHLVMPLIKAFDAASKQKSTEPLQDRIRAALKKLSGLKKLRLDDSDSATSESIPELLKQLVDLANSGTPLIVQLAPQNLFGHLCNMVFKCAQQLQSKQVDKQMLDIYIKAIDDFFFKGRCQLPLPFFSIPMQGSWSSSVKVAEKLTECTFSAKTRQYRRTQGFNLLTTLIKSNKSKLANQEGGSGLQMAKVIQSVTGHVAADLEAFMKGSSSSEEGAKAPAAAKPRYLSELLNLVNVLRVHGGAADDQDENWPRLVDALRKVRGFMPTTRHFRDVKKVYNKTCTPLKIDPITSADKKTAPASNSTKKMSIESKPKGGDSDSDDDDEDDDEKLDKANGDAVAGGQVKKEGGGKKKRKKKSKEGQQKRKEQKMNDYQGQLEDREIPSFAGLLLNDNMNFAPVEDKDKATEPATDESSAKKAKKSKKRKNSGSEEVASKTAKAVASPKSDASESKPKKAKKKKTVSS